MTKNTKTVIIIGGGFAGSTIAQGLEKKLKVILIDEKPYFEFTPSILRTLVEPEHLQHIQALHSSYLKKAKVICQKVKTIERQAVVLKNGQRIPYDYLVIASGTRYNTPIKDPNLIITSRASSLQKFTDKLGKAETVLIIGGGIVGVELTAEIITHGPQKKVTIIHSHSSLINRTPKKAQQYAQQFLKKKGVKIIYGEKIISHNGKYLSDRGHEYSAELAFMCTGVMANCEHLGSYCSCLDTNNYALANDYLQLKEKNKIIHNIFAAGDIVALDEEKTAQAAEKQAQIVIKNILNLEQHKPLKKYLPDAKPMVISLGKYDGILIYKNIVLTGIIPGILKGLIEWKSMRRFKG